MLELMARFAVEVRSPTLREVHLVRTEDMAELGPVIAVYQPDQFGWTKGVCNRAFVRFMCDCLNHIGQAGFSQ